MQPPTAANGLSRVGSRSDGTRQSVESGNWPHHPRDWARKLRELPLSAISTRPPITTPPLILFRPFSSISAIPPSPAGHRSRYPALGGTAAPCPTTPPLAPKTSARPFITIHHIRHPFFPPRTPRPRKTAKFKIRNRVPIPFPDASPAHPPPLSAIIDPQRP